MKKKMYQTIKRDEYDYATVLWFKSCSKINKIC